MAFVLLALLASCGSQPTEQSTPSPAPGVGAQASTAPPNEEAATAALNEINRAQMEYFQRNRRYALDYDELIAARFLSNEPQAAEMGYEIRMRPAADAATYTVTATPAGTPPAGSNARRMSTNQTGEIIFE